MNQQRRQESYKRLREIIQDLNSRDDFVWVGSMILLMPIVADDTRKGPLATDGRSIYFNPERVAQTGNADALRVEMGGLALGCALKHHTRRGDRDPWKWQWASWQTRLPVMRDAKLTTEQGGLDMSVTQAYELAPDPQPGDDEVPQGGSSVMIQLPSISNPPPGQEEQDDPWDDEGSEAAQEPPPSTTFQGHGEIMDSPALDEPPPEDDQGDSDQDTQDGAEDAAGQAGGGEGDSDTQDETPAAPKPASDPVQEEEQKWDEALQHAMTAAKARGTEAGTAKSLIEAGYGGKLDCMELLRRFLTSVAQIDYSWNRPNRRFIDEGLYLPSLYGETMRGMVFGVDTSGSMSDLELNVCYTEIRAWAAEMQPEFVTIIQCDAEVNKVNTWHPSELPAKLDMYGRGGTSFVPVFDWIHENLTETPACLVYMTDTMGDWPERAPDYPVLVVATQGAYASGMYPIPYWAERVDLPVMDDRATA